jgi:hypothetical protein
LTLTISEGPEPTEPTSEIIEETSEPPTEDPGPVDSTPPVTSITPSTTPALAPVIVEIAVILPATEGEVEVIIERTATDGTHTTEYRNTHNNNEGRFSVLVSGHSGDICSTYFNGAWVDSITIP